MEICFRCKNNLVDITPDDLEGIQFFGCHGCGSHYTKNPGKQLCDRWLMPITLPLYNVIFEENPMDKLKQTMFMLRKEKPEGLIQIVEHIKDELNEPKQNLCDTHDFVYPNEAKLREFLAAVMQNIEDKLNQEQQN
jgi:hypothetical protein